MKCSKCGAELDPEALFCSECGNKVEKKVKRFCRQCGTDLAEGAKFCSKCGIKVLEMDLDTPGHAKEDSSEYIEGETSKASELESEETSPAVSNSPTLVPPDSDDDQKKDQSLGIKLKEKVLSVWDCMNIFSKSTTIASILIVILTGVAVCIGKALPIIVSVLQIGALVVAILAHKGIIKIKAQWAKYLILCAAILLSVANIASYSVGKHTGNQPSVTQPDAKVCTPYSAADSIGKSKDEVIRDFRLAGFKNISEQAIADLTLDESGKDGNVESVSINSVTDFAENQEFLNSSSVVVSYHSIIGIAAPTDTDTASITDTEELIQLFKDAGFINIQTDEVFDIDPDEENVELKNVVTINGESVFNTTTEFPINADIKIVTHRAYEKYTLRIVVDFVENLIFSTYDVEMNVNGDIVTLNHGEDGTFDYRLKPGKYTVTFTSAKSSSVKGVAEIDLSGETEASYKITCRSDEISVETLYIENHSAVGEDEAMVPASASTCKYKDYKEVEEWFQNAGFTNLSTEILYDIVWGWTDEGEVEKVSIDGKSDFMRGDVFAKDIPIVITYHMKEDDDPNKSTESPTEAEKPTESAKKYDLDKNLIVAQCNKDKDKTTMYRITFAECDTNGNYTQFYTFDSIINPRTMGKEFNAIGPLPSWFYVGATVHVKANLSGGAISQSECIVTKAEGSADDSTDNSATMPIMPGTSLDTVIRVAREYGLSAQFSDEDWGHGTKMHGMDNGGLSLEIVYSTSTKEVLLVSVVSYTGFSTTQEQKDFIKAISGVACPASDTEEVSRWVNNNIGNSGITTINNVTYELRIGPSGNLCYSAGEAEWESWELSFD